VDEAVSSPREIVLGRVRTAIAGATTEPVARGYRREGSLESEARIQLLCERIGDYKAEVRRVRAAALSTAVGEVLEERGAHRIGVPAGVTRAWLPDGIEAVLDDGLDPAALDALDGVLTGCTIAIAETATIVLCGGPTEGRRALTLVPDLHVCVVSTEQIVELLPEATETLAALARHGRQLTFVSGPSATSDIELSRVEGVHGPRTLVVLVTDQEPT
jgi:L-lactate dehydrogenase complex protein LldG